MLIDSHCHLDYLEKNGQDIADVITHAQSLGVMGMVSISTTLRTFPDVRSIAERYDNIWCTVGIHPNHVGEEDETNVDELIELAKHPKVIGIGESGLDYHYDYSPVEKQQRQFRIHIQAARETGLPLVVHTRSADDDTIAILRDEYENGGEFSGLIHCYSAGHQLAIDAIDMGLYISCSGIVTFKNSQSIRDTIAVVPNDMLLVETDSPYLAPVPYRGKENTPAYTRHTAEVVADVKGISYPEMAEQTTNNFFTLFKKADRTLLGL